MDYHCNTIVKWGGRYSEYTSIPTLFSVFRFTNFVRHWCESIKTCQSPTNFVETHGIRKCIYILKQFNFYFVPRQNNLKGESLGLKTIGTITVEHFIILINFSRGQDFS